VIGKPKLSIVLSSAALGAMLFFATVPAFRERRSFFLGATVHNATIVQVDQEEKGNRRWRRFVAYIPVVQITDENGVNVNLSVDDYSKSPVYRIGDRIEVLCNRDVSGECIVNTLSEKWGDIFFNFFMSLLCFLPFLRYQFYPKARPDNYKRRPLKLREPVPLTVLKSPNPFKRRRKKR
jgi:hypothetical protein